MHLATHLRISLLMLLYGAGIAFACTAQAQDAPVAPVTADDDADIVSGWSPRSGDAWIDAQLGDINLYGNRYRGAFVDEVVRYHAAPRELVAELLASRAWMPGDVYCACALAQIAGRPCRAAVALREQFPGDGWDTIAASLGVGDDRDVVKRLKQAITASYRHWARPPAKVVAVEDGGKPKGVRSTKIKPRE